MSKSLSSLSSKLCQVCVTFILALFLSQGSLNLSRIKRPSLGVPVFPGLNFLIHSLIANPSHIHFSSILLQENLKLEVLAPQ